MAFPIRRLIDVARRPIVETGANVPGYSGRFAACRVISCLDPEECGARLTERFSDDPSAGTTSLGKFLKIARDWLDYFGNINILSI
jgi:hypothetical protein